METYYKATRRDGTDFRTSTVDYGNAFSEGYAVVHGAELAPDNAATYLSVSVDPASTLMGGFWPCRLFRVVPEGAVVRGLRACPKKRAVSALRLVEELEAWRALGPNGQQAAAFIESIPQAAQEAAWDAAQEAAWEAAREAAWDAGWDAAHEAARGIAWDAARGAAREAAWNAACDAAREAARDAVAGLVVRDLITPEHFDTVTRPWKILTGQEL